MVKTDRSYPRRTRIHPLAAFVLAVAGCGGVERSEPAEPDDFATTAAGEGADPGESGAGGVAPRVSAGGDHSCAIVASGESVCWGKNFFGQATAPGEDFVDIGAGSLHSCGLMASGRVSCWGFNGDGRADAPAGSFRQVSVGRDYACGIRSDGSAACWGGEEGSEWEAPAGKFLQVSAGGEHCCGVMEDKSIKCWRARRKGKARRAKRGVSQGRGKFRPPAGEFTAVAVGDRHACAVAAEGSVVCWGDDSHGQATPPPGEWTRVSAGRAHSCGLRGDGSVVCWGAGGVKDRPDNSIHFGQSSAPAGTFVDVSAGESHTCGMLAEGLIDCWGSNGNGRASPPPEYASMREKEARPPARSEKTGRRISVPMSRKHKLRTIGTARGFGPSGEDE
jgi:alpha-tubulin suppressor-like RCC1 family protein